ncbi:hypothetical protein LINPERPRIM_LOCUS10102 [Linum perenne]
MLVITFLGEVTRLEFQTVTLRTTCAITI